MRKKEIQKLYRLEPEMGSRGRIKEVPVYIGGYYFLDDKDSSYKKVAGRILGLVFLSFIFFVLAALPDPRGLRQIYIALPYISLFLPYAFTVVGCVTLLGVKDGMNEIQYADGIKRILRDSIIARVMIVMSAIAEIAFTAFNATKCKMSEEIFLFACVAVMFFLNEMRYRNINKVMDAMIYKKSEAPVEGQ